MSLDLASLGFSKEELLQRIVDQACESLLYGDEMLDGIQKQIDARVKKQVLDKINELAEQHVLPNVARYVENITMQETNQWGEAKGVKITFVEFLVNRANAYLQEQVDGDGKSKTEKDSYNWSGKQTRITHLVHAHLHNSIKQAMEEAMKVGVGEIARGIHETARLKLNEIAAGMKVQVTTK